MPSLVHARLHAHIPCRSLARMQVGPQGGRNPRGRLHVKIDLERGGVHSDLPLVTSTFNRKRTQTIPDPTQARHGSQMPMPLPLDEPNYLQGRSSQPSVAVPDEPGPFGKLLGNPRVMRRGP